MKSSYYQKTLLVLSGLLFYGTSLGQGSIQLEEGTNLDYRTITNDVAFPWEILWGGDGMLWVTEKGSGSTRPQISRIDPNTGAKTIIYTAPEGLIAEIDAPPGLLGMAFHPNFNPNNPNSDVENGSNIVYITYTSGDFTQDLAMLRYDGSILSDLQVLVQTVEAPSNHGSRLIITNDDKLLWSTGSEDAPRDGQNLDDLIGKILRVNLDGTVPTDNPFYTTADAARSKVYSYGHRNPQGIIQLPPNHPTLPNFIYSSEHGATENDELNLIQPGNNYGWSAFQGFCTNSNADNTCPLVAFYEAPTGLLYYDHPAIPEWSGQLLMGTSRGQKMVRFLIDQNTGEVENKDLNGPTSNNLIIEGNQYDFEFAGALARPRAMTMSPDGKVYVASLNAASDGSEDRIFVIENPDFSGCGTGGTPTCELFSITTAPEVTICDAQNLSIELSGSEQGTTYQLMQNGNATGIIEEGTGCNLSFDLTPSFLIANEVEFRDGDVFTIEATSDDCSQTMTGSVTLHVNNLFSANYYPTNGTSEAPDFQGLTYQWYDDNGIIIGADERFLEESTSEARVVVTNCNCSVWGTPVDDRDDVSFGHQIGDQFIHSSPINNQLDVPWAIEYGNDDNLWVTERDLGQVLRVDPESGSARTVLELGATQAFDATTSPRAGLMGMAIDWDATPTTFYLAYTYNDGELKLRISSFEYNEASSTLENEEILVEDIPSETNHGSALLFDGGTLYATTGSVDNDEAQELTNLIGKILAIDVANPSTTISELIYSYGHRNSQGMAIAPDGKLYSSEHGEVGGDELNLIQDSFNYGWPAFRGACENSTPDQNECPELVFGSVAPGGLAYYPADGNIDQFRNSILMANLRASSLISIPLTENYEVSGEMESYIGRSDCGVYGRLRDVTISPQGEVYILANGNSDLPAGIFRLGTNFVMPPLGNIDEGITNTLSVYPNPTSSVINLNHQIQTFKIYDVSGAEVVSAQLDSPSSQLDVGFLKPGVYFLNTIVEGIKEQVRIIKE